MSCISSSEMFACPIVQKFDLGQPCTFLRNLDAHEQPIIDRETQEIARKHLELLTKRDEKQVEETKSSITVGASITGAVGAYVGFVVTVVDDSVLKSMKNHPVLRPLSIISGATAIASLVGGLIGYAFRSNVRVEDAEQALMIPESRKIRMQRKVRHLEEALTSATGMTKDQLTTVSDSFESILRRHGYQTENRISIDHRVTKF